MLNLGIEPQKVFWFSKSSFLPISLVGIFLIYFCSVSEYSENTYHAVHTLFAVSVALSLCLMGYFRQAGSAMFASVIAVSYLVINAERYIYGEDYIFSAGYNIWSILLFPNLLLACFLFQKRETHKYWSWFYVFLLAQTAVIERLKDTFGNADSYYFYKHLGMLNYPAVCSAAFCLSIMFFCYINKGKLLMAASLFSTVAVLIGVSLSDNLFAFSLFFCASALCELLGSLYYVSYIRFKDEELNAANSAAYYNEAENKYPLKYSIALLYIDEYERLLKRFGKNKTLLLKKMFLTKIKKINPEVLVYAYKPDALILAFTNKNMAESYEQAEEIRRALAKSIFIFNENNHLQLTVSQCVSEKKRSDADAKAVLARAEENLQKACKFTRNITIKA